LSAEGEIDRLKKSGDNILTSLQTIKAGQTALVVHDWTKDNGGEITIKLNPNLSSVQNAQAYYRQYAKLRSRQGAAQSTIDEVTKRLDYLNQLKTTCEEASEITELRRIKETLSGRKPQQERGGRGDQKGQQQKQAKSSSGAGGGKSKTMTLQSSDGWTIYVGRNRMENDHLLNKVANPNDLWLHVLGQGGAHVLIRVPSNKQEPPKTTINEAAQIAARLSKAGTGTKVRVVYTQCKFVKKTDPNKPGLVRYENEKTVEVDTAAPMPKLMKKLFN
jgi:predicted ribosome quality control (RQC) complex YloA/Tae2 family protein